jgi:DNA polymerase-3 subunit beta
MKLICTQENLKRAIGAVERAAGRQSALPVLANVLLETEAGRLKLSTTNLEIGIVARIGAKVESEGSLTVPVKILSQFVGNLPTTEVVTLEETAQSLLVSCGGYRVKIKGLPASDFPIIPEKKNTRMIEVPAQSLKTALSRLLPCVALQDTRLELSGVNFLFSEKEVALAATDSFRLAEEIFSLEKYLEEATLAELTAIGSLILPATTLLEVSRAIAPTHKTLSMTIDENQAFFEMEGVEVISRLILGKFPDYRQIMPREFSFSATIEKESFLRSLRIASVFAAGEIAIELVPEEEKIVVEAVSSGVGEQRAEVPAKFSKGDGRLRAVFPPKSLLDGVGFMETSSIAFLANTPGTPVALSMTDGDVPRPGFTYIMMPIQK